MSDLTSRIEQLEALRPSLGDVAVNAAIAALRAQVGLPALPAAAPISTGDVYAERSQVVLGSGNYVLRDIQVAAGGILQIGSAPADLPPDPEALRRALDAYLRTLFTRYQFLSLRGIGAAGRQLRLELRAVFVNLRTDVTIAEAAALFGEQPGRGTRATKAGRTKGPGDLSADARRWLDELLSDDERALVLGEQRPRRRDAPEADLNAIRARLSTPRTALELIRHEPALVILGDPGSGKTTVMRYAALGFALARLAAGDADATPLDAELAWTGPLPLPLFVPLRRFAATLDAPPADCNPLLRFIEQMLTGDRLASLARHLETRLDAGEGLILLDGLDEVADDTRRGWVARAIEGLHSRFPRSRAVVTCRTYAYRDAAILSPPFQVARLQPLDTAAQDDFVHRWYRAALQFDHREDETQAAENRAADLIAALDRRPRLREIGGNPLLLTLTARVHESGMGLPQQRAELYERCLLLLLEDWERERSDDGAAGLAATLGVPDRLTTTGARLALIQPAAFELMRLGHEEASNAEVRGWLLERFLDLAQDDGRLAKRLIDRFLEFLEGRSGLLIARDVRDRYAFPHRTFQEYLAARELIYRGHNITRAEVLARRHENAWREVIRLVAGHLVATSQAQQAKELAWALLDADSAGSDAAYRSAVLAGELVEELRDSLGRDGRTLRDQIAALLAALVEGGCLPAPERVAAAFLLGRLGDPRLSTPEQANYWCDVPAGAFWYGDKNLRQVELPYAFRIGRYPVANAEYARFVAAGGYHERRWWSENGWAYIEPGGQRWYEDEEERITRPRLWDDARFNNPTQPVVGVSWYEAAAYCAWLTAQLGLPAGAIRLPTSLEWERAARGTDQRPYPWGTDDPTPEHANYDATGIGASSPVGCFPQGIAACGALDMAGNVWEWTATANNDPDNPELRKDFTPMDGVVLRGGSWYNNNAQLRCGSRVGFSANNGIGDWSFRLVWSLALNR